MGKERKKSQVNYDKSLDTLTYDTSLEEVYDKTYIKNQYIFKDDTVKIMRQKLLFLFHLMKNMEILNLYQNINIFGVNISLKKVQIKL